MTDSTLEDPRTHALSVRGATITLVNDATVVARAELGAPIRIGTGEDATIRLDDPKASRRHARLVLGAEGLVLQDEESKNGTWIGGLRIDRAVLTSQTRIRIGDTELDVRFDDAVTEIPLSRRTRIGGVIGASPAMKHVFSLIERAAFADVTVLLEGESGVGKEVLAHAIHALSARSQKPFVTVDCGAIPKELLESELFGHARGAFTGANASRVGLFEQANGGTLFLDEIGELPIDLQPKLLRALEAREVRPVGSNDVRAIDVRVVAATNRSLGDEMRRGAFRQDLFYRLAVARVHVAPLRDRKEDIAVLANAFYREIVKDDAAALPADVMHLFRAYPWPGNVRELRNVVSRYALLGFSGRALFDESTPAASRGAFAASSPGAAPEWSGRTYHDARAVVIDRFEEAFVRDALARANGVVVRAAELAGMARSTFYRMVEKHGLRPNDEDE